MKPLAHRPYAVILAGGGGTRLWPLSTPSRPKPFIPLLGEETLFQRTVRRVLDGSSGLGLGVADIAVVTAAPYAEFVRAQAPGVTVLAEPVGRNTAAAIALATVALERDDDEVMVVLPADQTIEREAEFRATLGAAARAARDGVAGVRSPLVTLAWIAPGTIWLLLFLIAPLIMIVLVSIWTRTPVGFEKWSFTLDAYGRIFETDVYRDTLFGTFVRAIFVTALCVVMGYPVAFFLARCISSIRYQIALFIFVLAPFWVAYVVRIVAWLPVLGRQGVINYVIVEMLHLRSAVPTRIPTRPMRSPSPAKRRTKATISPTALMSWVRMKSIRSWKRARSAPSFPPIC